MGSEMCIRDSDGKSHIEDFLPPFEPFVDTEGAHGDGTPMENASGFTIRRSAPDYFLDYHTAPRRQYVVNIAGIAEFETADGTKVRMVPGDILVAEDLTGHGHIARSIGDEPRISLAIPMPG